MDPTIQPVLAFCGHFSLSPPQVRPLVIAEAFRKSGKSLPEDLSWAACSDSIPIKESVQAGVELTYILFGESTV